ncbi:MAG TPA: DUF3459 domain-containing protein, partial [Euzebya sp.]|nr:DUF3459 domain-containing protein [Euzebya sp.]
VPPDLVRVAIALLCLAPHTPMLFMGEEYGETNPFQFFSDMPGEDLREAIRQGRRREFEAFTGWQGDVPDPLDHATFQRSTLDRAAAEAEAGQQRRALWRDLLALRRTQPALATGNRDLLDAHVLEHTAFIHRRPSPNHPYAPMIAMTANLSDADITVGADTLLLSTADPRYGGTGPLDAGTVAARSVAVHAVPHDPADLPGAEPSS